MARVDLSQLHQNILNETLTRLKTLLRAESASVFLFDTEHQELVLNSIFSDYKAQFKGTRQRIGEGIAGSVAGARKAVLVKDIKTDPRFQKERFRHYHTDSFICLPIITSFGLIGVINISDKESGDVFSEEDFELACLVSHLASLIVENEMALAGLISQNEALKGENAANSQERVFLEKFASLGKLAGGIVHEINNPLDAVIRYTNLLIEKDIDPSVSREYLNEIKVGLTRIMKITRSLLEFANQLKDSPRNEYVDVHDMVEEALSLFRHVIVNGAVKVERRYGQDLPRLVDKGLCRIFSNLIKNAIDAMPGGGTLMITTRMEEDHLAVCFKDTGCGIADDVKEKIFTPFFTTKPMGHGVGLGLPICFEVIQRYEGKIDVDSKVGEGTEFKIRLPFADSGALNQ